MSGKDSMLWRARNVALPSSNLNSVNPVKYPNRACFPATCLQVKADRAASIVRQAEKDDITRLFALRARGRFGLPQVEELHSNRPDIVEMHVSDKVVMIKLYFCRIRHLSICTISLVGLPDKERLPRLGSHLVIHRIMRPSPEKPQNFPFPSLITFSPPE